MIKILPFFFILAFCLTACSDEECITGGIEIRDIEDFGCGNTAFSMEVNTSNEFELIRNQDEFEMLVASNCSPDINWQEFDLIAGQRSFDRGVDSVVKSLVRDCLNNQVILRITFNLNDTTEAVTISFNTLIPKLSNDQLIFVEFIINE
jgi:hypothetical protein